MIRRFVCAAVIAAVAVACTDPTPQERFTASMRRTWDGSFTYELTVEADREALDSLGGSAIDAGAFLDGFAVRGIRDGAAVSLGVVAFGIDVLEIRRVDEALYLRIAAQELAALAGSNLASPDVLASRLRAAGVGDAIIDVLIAAIAGDWIGIEGELSVADLAAAIGATASPSDEASDGVLDGGLEGFIERYVVVDAATTAEGSTRYDLDLRFRDLLEAGAALDPTDVGVPMDDAPEIVPAEASVHDGLVTELSVDLAETTRLAGGDATGSVVLLVSLDDHGAAPAITVPEVSATATAGELLAAMRAVAAM